MAISIISEGNRFWDHAIAGRVLTWLFTTSAATKPTAPFTLRWMTTMGDSVTPGTELVANLYSRYSFSFPAASNVDGGPRAYMPNSDTFLGYLDSGSTKVLAGAEIWDSAGTPVRIYESPFTGTVTVTTADYLTLAADGIGISFAATGPTTVNLTTNAMLRALDFVNGRTTVSRPNASSFSLELVLKNTGSLSGAGDPLSDSPHADLYSAATGITFTVTDVSGTWYAVNAADINFGPISSTKHWFVWAWELYDLNGDRIAFRQETSAFFVRRGENFKIPAGSLKVAIQ